MGQLSEEHKQKISIALKGRKQSPEHISNKADSVRGFKMSEEAKNKISILLKGKKAWNKGVKSLKPPESYPRWKGGITNSNAKIRNSCEYRLWREAVFARDSWTCQECEKRGCYLHAHHIKSFSEYPELRLAIDNGISLCKTCHALKHKDVGFFRARG